MRDTNGPDNDDVLRDFSAARAAALNDKTLLHAWTTRYPEFADELIAIDFARFTAGMTLSDALGEGLEDPDAVAAGLAVLAARREASALPALQSLVTEAAARGLDAVQFARTLRLDRLLLGRLEQRALDAASLPRSLIQQIAQTLGRSADEVAAYLRGSPRLAARAHFRASRAPSIDAQAAQPSFVEALERSQNMNEEDRAYWQSQIDAGVLGEETMR